MAVGKLTVPFIQFYMNSTQMYKTIQPRNLKIISEYTYLNPKCIKVYLVFCSIYLLTYIVRGYAKRPTI